jgi:hypothetical protein
MFLSLAWQVRNEKDKPTNAQQSILHAINLIIALFTALSAALHEQQNLKIVVSQFYPS